MPKTPFHDGPKTTHVGKRRQTTCHSTMFASSTCFQNSQSGGTVEVKTMTNELVNIGMANLHMEWQVDPSETNSRPSSIG